MSTRCTLLVMALIVAPAVSAQTKVECERFGWWGRRGAPNAHVCEARDLTLPASGTLTVDARPNGGVSVTGEDRRDVQVRATVHAWGRDDAEAARVANEVVVLTDPVLRAQGPERDQRAGWNVSFEIRTPHDIDLSLETQNGGITLESIRGDVDFETVNGGVTLNDVAGNVRGETTNGGVTARLTGETWDGVGLDLRTTNGGVHLRVPDDYSARLEAETVNGGISVGFPVTVQGRIGRELSTTLGRGGPLVRVRTTNGGVRVE